MPHSSGGGSHGGGSHGGSHGGHGGGNSVRTSRSYFPGAHRYVHYRKGRPRYVYRSEPYRSGGFLGSPIGAVVAAVFLFLFYGMFFAGFLKDMVHFPTRISVDYDDTILINDELGIVGEDYDRIVTAFQQFRENTGVTPALAIVSTAQWDGAYYDPQSYAYEYYLDHFDDEKHWLIVYFQAENNSEDWYWEGMQGDDTDPVISTAIADHFTKNLQKKFEDRRHYTVGEAVAVAFDELEPKVTKLYVDFSLGNIGILAFLLFHGGIFFFAMVIAPVREKRMAEEAVEIDPHRSYSEETCRYCGNVYLRGIHKRCPYCDAALATEEDFPDADRYRDYGWGE